MTQYRKHQPIGDSMSLQCVECGAFDKDHYAGCSSLRPFPIQSGGSIPWWLAELAYEFYNANWPGQTLQRLSERGGFGVGELVAFIRKDKDDAWTETLPSSDQNQSE